MDLTEWVVGIGSAKAVVKTTSKIITKALSELTSALNKAKGVTSAVSSEVRATTKALRRGIRSQLAKINPRRTPRVRRSVETAKLPGFKKPPTLRPNIQLFAEADKTIWSRIRATADKMPGTEIPATFQIDLNPALKYVNPQTGTNTLWTNANASKHMQEFINRFENPSLGIRSQSMLKSYSAALDEAMKGLTIKPLGRHEIICGGWEFGINTEKGIVFHAKML